MPGFPEKWLRRPAGRCRSVPLLFFLACLILPSCDHPEHAASPQSPNPIARQLAGAWHDMALSRLAANQPAEALNLFVASLEADPTFADSLREIRPLLAETRWSYPDITIDCGLPIEHAVADGDFLWTSVSDPEGYNTAARWNLKTLRVENVLFPRPSERTDTFRLSPDRSRLLLTRGTDSWKTTLLCDAISLRPITVISDQAADSTSLPSPTFAPGVPLFAEAVKTGDKVRWSIRDISTGEILRSHEVAAFPGSSAAVLTNDRLRIYQNDRTVLTVPISPVEEPTVESGAESPLHPPEISSVEISGNHVEIRRTLPAPKTTGRAPGPLRFNPERILPLQHLAQAISGVRFDPQSRTFIPLTESQRRTAIAYCHHPDDLLDGLDFTELVENLRSTPFRESAADAAFVLRDRIARASSAPPRFLALHSDTAPPSSPEQTITEIFETSDSEKILAAIRGATPQSPAAAIAFRHALESSEPSWITASLEANPQVPAVLQRFAFSRLAWLQNRKPDALALWRHGFPDIEISRRTEDWNGWETADFRPVFESHFDEVRAELVTYEVAENAAAEERRSLAERLLDPAASQSIGKERHAAACLAAAQTSAPVPEEIDTTLELLTLARALGAPPADCLRTEATAHMSAADFTKSHECWISLISDFPVETHQSRDYAEAAYTAFETGNPEQAMAILGTAVTRFRNDTEFSYRAGWIALLTGRYAEAYEFLLVGERIGFPEDRLEKATALLAIAASGANDGENATIFYNHLVDINPEWSSADPPKADGWPPELKGLLFEIAQPPRAIPVQEDGEEMLILPE